MVDARWSSRQIAFGGFVLGFFIDLSFQTVIFDDPFEIFLFFRASVMGVVWALVFSFAYPQTTTE